MKQLFTSDFFAGNRARLRELAKTDTPIVVVANGLLQRTADTTFSFQQDSSFWYLTGISEPDLVLVMDKKGEYLIAPERTKTQDIFDGSIDWKAFSQQSGIAKVLAEPEGYAQLLASLKKSRAVATLDAAPAYIAQIGMYVNPARQQIKTKILEAVPDVAITDIRPLLAQMRIIKQEPEISAIKKAVDITCTAFLEVHQRSYQLERELEADLTQLYRKAGAEDHAYAPIVASGLNACTLHYIKNNARLKRGSLVLVDSGAEYSHYAADITRTWSPSKPTARQRVVVQAVNEAVEYGIGTLRPGESFIDCEALVREFIGDKLVELKLIKSKNKDSVRQYYPHSPHYLGLDVHDVGDYKAPLQPGMVLTLEPGIYIPEEFIGVRIEEDILITEKGAKVLSAALPRVLN
jgi:Xaa-Pro aminopeptidase